MKDERFELIAKAMGWLSAGSNERGWDMVKRSTSEYCDPEPFFGTDDEAQAIASQLGLTIDYRRGFVEAPGGQVAQFEIGSSAREAIFDVVSAIGKAMP